MYHLKQFSNPRYTLGGTALSSLKTLRLEYGGIGDDRMKILSDAWIAGAMNQLYELDVGANNIGATGARYLADALRQGALQKLGELFFGDEVADSCLGDDGLIELIGPCETHGALPQLETLSLWNSGIGDRGINEFVLACHRKLSMLPSLKVIHLDGNNISLASFEALKDANESKGGTYRYVRAVD